MPALVMFINRNADPPRPIFLTDENGDPWIFASTDEAQQTADAHGMASAFTYQIIEYE